MYGKEKENNEGKHFFVKVELKDEEIVKSSWRVENMQFLTLFLVLPSDFKYILFIMNHCCSMSREMKIKFAVCNQLKMCWNHIRKSWLTMTKEYSLPLF